jgi:hypothetical protein
MVPEWFDLLLPAPDLPLEMRLRRAYSTERKAIEECIQRHRSFGRTKPTIVIGGGVHGVTFAMNSRLRPYILSSQFGGEFRGDPLFYLNSRNRPGELGLPGTEKALNAMPGCPVQASQFDGFEYQVNTPLGFAIEVNAALYSRYRRLSAFSVEKKIDGDYLLLTNGGGLSTQRLIIATGIGTEPKVPLEGTLSLRAALTQLRGNTKPLKRVAVVGAGNSGNVMVEALLGQGPISAPFVDRIDWFGQRLGYREEWEDRVRSRYHAIGRDFPCEYDDSRPYRIDSRLKARRVLEGRFVESCNEVTGPYDMIVNCTGFKNQVNKLIEPLQLPLVNVYDEQREVIARRVLGEEVYVVGPAAEIPFTEAPKLPQVARSSENSVAIWRTLPKTVKLAKMI